MQHRASSVQPIRCEKIKQGRRDHPRSDALVYMVALASIVEYRLNEHSEQARAPHTDGPKDVPRCGALSLLQKPLTKLN
jgi:hypothetical protein